MIFWVSQKNAPVGYFSIWIPERFYWNALLSIQVCYSSALVTTDCNNHVILRYACFHCFLPDVCGKY